MSKHVFGMWLFGSNKISYIYIMAKQYVSTHLKRGLYRISVPQYLYTSIFYVHLWSVMFIHVVFTHLKKLPKIIISMGFQDIPTIPKWTPHHTLQPRAARASSWCGGDSRPGEDTRALGTHAKMIYKWWMFDKHLNVYRHLGWSGMFIWYHLILSKRHEHSTWTT
jgi:hypothetical protein